MDGFEAMGHPVSDHRRETAYRHARDMGLSSEQSMRVVGAMADAVERDDPYRALGTAGEPLDITGRYRLLAVLCTA